MWRSSPPAIGDDVDVRAAACDPAWRTRSTCCRETRRPSRCGRRRSTRRPRSCRRRRCSCRASCRRPCRAARLESGVHTSAPFSLSRSVIFFGARPSGSLIQISSRPERSETKARNLPSADHFGAELRDAILSGATRVMSPRSVAIVKICPRAEMTARRPDGERSNASTSLVIVSNSISFSFSSEAMSSLISLVLPDATSSFQMPKLSS